MKVENKIIMEYREKISITYNYKSSNLKYSNVVSKVQFEWIWDRFPTIDSMPIIESHEALSIIYRRPSLLKKCIMIQLTRKAT
jgi:hypothetical protein